MRTPFIAGNWKMHKTIDEAVALVEELRSALQGVVGCDVAICPPPPTQAALRPDGLGQQCLAPRPSRLRLSAV